MGLTPQQWERIKALFEAAVEKPAAERPSFLAAASRDTAVVREVERQLANHEEAGSFLSSPAESDVCHPERVGFSVCGRSGESKDPGDNSELLRRGLLLNVR